jgi:beta-N-acetylhexosaminidase
MPGASIGCDLRARRSRILRGGLCVAIFACLPGALLLGRIFSMWNLLAYGVGIAIGALQPPRGTTCRALPCGLSSMPS